eukprot:jgi/Mesvir1/14422/Mv09804-RA.1
MSARMDEAVPAVPDEAVIQFQDSHLPAHIPSGTMQTGSKAGPSSSSAPPEYKPPSSEPSSSFLSSLLESTPSQPGRSVFSIAHYQPYFDVDTRDVALRIKDALLPIQGDFLTKTADKPDLYGPFWICTTLVFVSAAMGNYASYLSFKGNFAHPLWKYDINKVTSSATIFYSYVGIMPVIFHFMLRYFGGTIPLTQLWCLYGYSLFAFIPASIVCILPSETMRWLIVLGACFVSSTFLLQNFRAQVTDVAKDKSVVILTGVAVTHLLLGLILKLYFFTYYKDDL